MVSLLTRHSKAMTTWHVSLSLLDHIPGHCSPNIQTDNIGFGGDLRRQGNKDVLDGNLTFKYEHEPSKEV